MGAKVSSQNYRAKLRILADPHRLESDPKTEAHMPDNDACPMPTPKKTGEQDAITQMLQGKRIAVVGMTPDPSRAGNYVPAFLRTRGKEIIPVNPTYPEVDGLKSYPTLKDVPGKVDVVLVFRRPEFCAQVAEE